MRVSCTGDGIVVVAGVLTSPARLILGVLGESLSEMVRSWLYFGGLIELSRELSGAGGSWTVSRRLNGDVVTAGLLQSGASVIEEVEASRSGVVPDTTFSLRLLREVSISCSIIEANKCPTTENDICVTVSRSTQRVLYLYAKHSPVYLRLLQHIQREHLAACCLFLYC